MFDFIFDVRLIYLWSCTIVESLSQNSNAELALVHDDDLISLLKVVALSFTFYAVIDSYLHTAKDTERIDNYDVWIHMLAPPVHVDGNSMKLFSRSSVLKLTM